MEQREKPTIKADLNEEVPPTTEQGKKNLFSFKKVGEGNKVNDRRFLQNKASKAFATIIVVLVLIWGADFFFTSKESDFSEEIIRTLLSLLTFIVGYLFAKNGSLSSAVDDIKY